MGSERQEAIRPEPSEKDLELCRAWEVIKQNNDNDGHKNNKPD
jgi:hypothetical protein